MKKIFIVLTLVFGLSIAANAQDSKLKQVTVKRDYTKINVQEEAKKDAEELKTLLSLNDVKTQDFYRLFEMKYEILSGPQYSSERRSEMITSVYYKIKASLDENQMAVLEKNKEFYERLKN